MSSESAPRRSDRCRAPASSSSPPRPRSEASIRPDPDWCNLGQGSPRPGAARGAAARARGGGGPATRSTRRWPGSGSCARRSPRTTTAPTGGAPSQYSAENVCVSGAGAPSLTRPRQPRAHQPRHFLPDYTAYEELLDVFKAFTAIPILLDPERGYAFGPIALKKEILGLGLSALLLSNPCNPTGRWCRARRWRLGRAGARPRLRAAHRRVLRALRLDRRPARARCRSAPRRTCGT
jgi:hypothetical protein